MLKLGMSPCLTFHFSYRLNGYNLSKSETEGNCKTSVDTELQCTTQQQKQYLSLFIMQIQLLSSLLINLSFILILFSKCILQVSNTEKQIV
jgi:hypothetical protein